VTVDLQIFCWPASRLGEALGSLARKSRLVPTPVDIPNPAYCAEDEDEAALTTWLTSTAASVHLEVEPVEVRYGDIEQFLRSTGPTLVRLLSARGAWFLAIIQKRRRSLLVVGPDSSVHVLPLEQVSEALCENI
jgi:hypothetical protein